MLKSEAVDACRSNRTREKITMLFFQNSCSPELIYHYPFRCLFLKRREPDIFVLIPVGHLLKDQLGLPQ